jgi:hypothetical protein
MTKSKFITIAGSIACAAVLTPSAVATLTFELNNVWNGGAGNPPTLPGTPPWVTAVFQQVDANTVSLTLTTGLDGDYKVGELAFNIKPSIDPPSLVTFARAATPTAVETAATLIVAPTDNGIDQIPGFDGDSHGGRGWDFEVEFSTADDTALKNGMAATFYLSKASGLKESDFNYLNNGEIPGEDHFVAAHIQPNSGASGAADGYGVYSTPIPEPTTLIAGALLLIPFGASTLRALRKNRKG